MQLLCVVLTEQEPDLAAVYSPAVPVLFVAQMAAASMVEPLPVKNAYHAGELPGILVPKWVHTPFTHMHA